VKTIICLSLIVICATQVTPARKLMLIENIEAINTEPFATTTVGVDPALPDLIVRGNEFEFVGNKIVNVYVSNNGTRSSRKCILTLTVRKIGNSRVGRVVTAEIPSIQPTKYVKIEVDATSILPVDVNLKDTTFKVVADSNGRNPELNENNNEKWHNLQ